METYFTMKRAPTLNRIEVGRQDLLCSARRLCTWMAIVLGLGVATVRAADPATNPPAAVKVSGFGILGNREMLRLLRNLQADGQFPPVIARNFVEDAALILFSRARNAGYLDAGLKAKATMLDGARQKFYWTNSLDVRLSRDFAASEVDFDVVNGVLYYYDSLEIEGLTAINEEDARNYFVSGDTLVRLHGNRAFSPGMLQSSITALTEELLRKGYTDAVVTTNLVKFDPDSGAVTVRIKVDEGLRSIVRSVAVTVDCPQDLSGTNHWVIHPDKAYSLLWQQNLARQLREQQYAKGYPDATVELRILQTGTTTNSIQLDFAADVKTGERVYVAGVKIKGNKRTRLSVMESRVKLEIGELLDRNEAEQSRQKLARLGVFRSVNLDYENVDATNRNVIYEVKESKPIALSVLAGYGSYELLRGGLEFENHNVLGYAQDLRLRAVQSFKSTSFEGQYTFPEIFGGDLSAFLRGSALRREEVSFTREEYGGSAGVHKYLDSIKTEVGLNYTYQFLNASDLGKAVADQVGVADAQSAGFILDFNRDQRHTPLLPRTGSRYFGRLEYAAADLGGNVNYQRIVLGTAQNFDLGGGRLLHLGLIHGITFTLGGDSNQLPFSKRFFPGGENSVRGYQEGEACPLDSNGDQLGAETYTQVNIELEQLITKSWSVVAFFDGVGFAQNRSDYPSDQELSSVGGGIRWLSPIGPVRLEYGYNLDRRPDDPVGTLHFSIGAPF
jgi:outer membrane protein insertion porin family